MSTNNPRRRSLRRWQALVLSFLATGCDGPAAGEGPRVPATITVLSGDLQQAGVGTELPEELAVRLLDQRSRPVPDYRVEFRVVVGNGSLSALAVNTDASGTARMRWRLGTVARDTQRVSAWAAAGGGQVITEFRAVAAPAAPATLTTPASSWTAAPGDSVPVTVRVADQYGNGISGQPVALTLLGGDGEVIPAEVHTDTGGRATARWRFGTAMDTTYRVRVSSGALTPLELHATTSSHRGRIEVMAGEVQSVPRGLMLPEQVVVRVTTAAGAPIRRAPISWEFGPGWQLTHTGVDGTTGAWMRAPLYPGEQLGVARLGIGGDRRTYFRVTVEDTEPERLHLIGFDQTPEIGKTVLVRVRVFDRNNTALPDVQVHWRPVCGGSLSSWLTTTGETGRTTVRWTVGACPTGPPSAKAFLQDGPELVFTAP